MKNITVVISTIGRDSLIKAIKSIPESCDLVVSVDKKFEDKVKDLNIKNIRSDIKIVKGGLGPGQVKQLGIDKVKTDWFILLDDDDYFKKNAFKVFNKIINKYSDKINWIGFSDKKPFKNLFSHVIVYNLEIFNSFYFNYTDYSKIYRDNHIYPANSTLIKTKTFRDKKYKFEGNYCDDVIPINSIMMYTKGIYLFKSLINYSSTSNSVSRSRLKYCKYKNILRKCNYRANKSKNSLEKHIWKRISYNIKSRVKDINSR